MGAEAAAVGALISAGTGVYGAAQARKAGKVARREARTQEAHQQEQATLYKAEQAKASQKEARLQEQANKQIARSNRRRIRGGLFGDASAQSQGQGLVRQTLGQ